MTPPDPGSLYQHHALTSWANSWLLRKWQQFVYANCTEVKQNLLRTHKNANPDNLSWLFATGKSAESKCLANVGLSNQSALYGPAGPSVDPFLSVTMGLDTAMLGSCQQTGQDPWSTDLHYNCYHLPLGKWRQQLWTHCELSQKTNEETEGCTISSLEKDCGGVYSYSTGFCRP